MSDISTGQGAGPVRPARRRPRVRVTSLVLFLAAVALCVAGINLGETATVFEKAVTICLSCIGIG